MKAHSFSSDISITFCISERFNLPTSRERDTKLNEAIVQGDGVAAADRETGRPDEPCRRSLATTGGADEGRGGGLAGQHHCGSRPATTQAKQHQVSNL